MKIIEHIEKYLRSGCIKLRRRKSSGVIYTARRTYLGKALTARFTRESILEPIYRSPSRDSTSRFSSRTNTSENRSVNSFLPHSSHSVQEIEIMKKFDHQHIVKFLQLVVTKKSLYIVTELCGNGDLQQLLNKKNLEEAEAL
jgi:serine/threonine protein kinase